jgi:hypothetical protein
MIFGIIAICAMVFFRLLTVTPDVKTTSLEAYIIAGNPQTADDIDRLAREYSNRNSQYGIFTYLGNNKG